MTRAASLILILLLSPVALAAAPPYYPLQGFLTDSQNQPLDGPISVKFSVYTSDIGGTLLWSETQSVAVNNGVFTVYLGTIAPLKTQVFGEHGVTWLGITVAGDPEMERVQLGSVPYAAYADRCGAAAPHTHSASEIPGVALAGQQCPGGQVMVGINASGTPMCTPNASSGNGTQGGLAGTGKSGQIPKFKSPTELTNSLLTESFNRVGINDSSPSHTLDVKGDLQVTGDFYWGGKKFSSSSCIVIGGSSCSSACGAHGMSCYKAFSIDKDNGGSTSCSQSGFKFCCCRN